MENERRLSLCRKTPRFCFQTRDWAALFLFGMIYKEQVPYVFPP